MHERIYIKDLQQKLNYYDRRSVKRWCYNNNVRILSDVGSNKHFVLRDEFEKAKSKNYNLSDWLDSSKNNKEDVSNLEKYTPKGEYEKTFLSIFTKLNTTL